MKSVKRSDVEIVIKKTKKFICPECKFLTGVYEEEYENGEAQCEECFQYFNIED